MRTRLALPPLAASIVACVVFALAGHASAAGYRIVNLVSNQAGVAQNQDPNLINGWGIAHAPGGPLWVSDNGTGKSTVYDRVTGQKQSLTVTIPGGENTGTVYVPADNDNDVDFPVTENGTTGASIFIFVSEGGLISGWNPNVDANNAVVAVDMSGQDASLKGVAVSPGRENLYVADFHNNKVLRFGEQFQLEGSFTDPDLPNRFAPFNVAVLGGNVYVAFAKRERNGDDEVAGNGLGYVDVFTRGGRLQRRLIANGPLNAPWGMMFAPKNFGQFGGALLVGNFGNGRINAFDRTTGAFLGGLTKPNGKPVRIDGLWGIEPGPNSTDITFAAGPDDESNGLMGLIEVAN
jgi:uncharacterized protein (TIGR03118 family)